MEPIDAIVEIIRTQPKTKRFPDYILRGIATKAIKEQKLADPKWLNKEIAQRNIAVARNGKMAWLYISKQMPEWVDQSMRNGLDNPKDAIGSWAIRFAKAIEMIGQEKIEPLVAPKTLYRTIKDSGLMNSQEAGLEVVKFIKFCKTPPPKKERPDGNA
jgi:hypothetical protein